MGYHSTTFHGVDHHNADEHRDRDSKENAIKDRNLTWELFLILNFTFWSCIYLPVAVE